MKKCEEPEELIHSYIDNELASEEIKQLESHAAICQSCRKKIEIFRGLKVTLKEKIKPVSAPLFLKERILKRQIMPPPAYPVIPFPRWAFVGVPLAIILGGIIFIQQMRKPSHFLVLRAEIKIQEHIDNCPACQKGAVKIIEERMGLASIQLQKRLDDCPDCHEKIVRMIEHCMGAMAWNKPRYLPELFVTG